jgi:hypothetical protein
LVRVRSKDGQFRVQLEASDTFAAALDKVTLLLVYSPFAALWKGGEAYSEHMLSWLSQEFRWLSVTFLTAAFAGTSHIGPE